MTGKKEKAEQKKTLTGDDSLQQSEAAKQAGATEPAELSAPSGVDDIEAPTSKPPPQDERDREMFALLSAITDSYKTIQSKLDTGAQEYLPGYARAQNYIHANNRRVERMCIFALLIPAFVMSVIATYRLNNDVYNFDLSELEKKEMNLLANQNFDRWNNALLSRSNAQVTELYATDVSFLPTMSDDFAVSERSEDRYFIHFVEKQPAGIIIEDKVQPMGVDAYLHAGLYDFLVVDPNNGVMSRVHARFTFMWRKFCDESQKNDVTKIIPGVGPDKNCQWRIVHHHSSLKPSECVGAAPASHAPDTTTPAPAAPAVAPAPAPARSDSTAATPAPAVAPAPAPARSNSTAAVPSTTPNP